MSDTEKRKAVMARYRFLGWDYPDHEALADRIVELEAENDRLRDENGALRAAVERVRALHTPISYPEGDFPNDKWCAHCEMIHGSVYWGDNDPTRWPCPTLRALEETP